MGIKLCPVDGNECSWGQVPQECQGLSKKYKPGSHICERRDHNGQSAQDSIIIGIGFQDYKEELDDEEDEASEGGYTNRDYSDSQRCDTPEFLF